MICTSLLILRTIPNEIMQKIERIFDQFFYHCYTLISEDDDFARASMASHLMLFVLLLPIYISLGSFATLIMPHKFAVVVGIALGVVVLLVYSELQNRYEDAKLRKKIIESYKPLSRMRSIMMIACYVFIISFPTLLVVLFQRFFN